MSFYIFENYFLLFQRSSSNQHLYVINAHILFLESFLYNFFLSRYLIKSSCSELVLDSLKILPKYFFHFTNKSTERLQR